jgi:hypothetical protein
MKRTVSSRVKQPSNRSWVFILVVPNSMQHSQSFYSHSAGGSSNCSYRQYAQTHHFLYNGKMPALLLNIIVSRDINSIINLQQLR